MKTRTLGRTGLQLTTIGLGTWAMGGEGWRFGWGPQDDQESIKAIHRALDLGINWIDTAPAYGLGHGEEVVGRALKGMAHRPIIATKCGRSWDANRELFPCLKRNVIRAEVEASLKRLGVEVIDLYQVHWPQPDADVEEAWSTVAEIVKEGKVRFAGVCNFNVAQLKRLQPIHPAASLQPPYSMLVRDLEQEGLAHCAAHNIGVVAYSPMQKGLLTDRFNRERVEQFAADDHRRRDAQFQEPLLSANLDLVQGLRSIAAKSGKTVSHLAMAWVLRRPEVTSAIVGARSASQIEETVSASDWTLSAGEQALIEDLLQRRRSTL
ncbi:MAG: aldo/keto reductase [Verrucomicrobia bacterium]|nr:aldo/keto reductase [Verrucomicrobiota bacterium]